MFMQLQCMKSFVQQFTCTKCGNNLFKLAVKSLKGLTWSLECICLNNSCGRKIVMKTCEDNFNDAAFVASAANGLKPVKVANFLADLNFCGKTTNGYSISVNARSTANIKCRQHLRAEIIAVGQAEQASCLKNVTENKGIDTVVCQLDGMYPVRGHQSSLCVVSLILDYTVNDVKERKMVHQVLVKQKSLIKSRKAVADAEVAGAGAEVAVAGADEAVAGADADAETDFSKVYEIWRDVSSKKLESEGIEVMLKGPIQQLIDAGKKTFVVTDGDLDLSKKLKNYDVQHLHDLAHIKKNLQANIQAILQREKFSGDNYVEKGKKSKVGSKIGNRNFLDLVKSLKTAISRCAAKGRSEEWGEEEMKTEICTVIDHYRGKSDRG